MGAASRCLALALLCTSFLLASATASSEMLMMTNRFHAWRAAHNRTYATAAEHQRRFEVYRRNVEYIEATNRRGGLSYQLGENQFTDLTSDDFLAAYTMPPGQVLAARDAAARRRHASQQQLLGRRLRPGSLQRRLDAVTPIKHQMTCGTYVSKR